MHDEIKKKPIKTEAIRRGIRRFEQTTYENIYPDGATDFDKLIMQLQSISKESREARNDSLSDIVNHIQKIADITYKKYDLPHGARAYRWKKEGDEIVWQDAAQECDDRLKWNWCLSSKIPEIYKLPFDHAAYLAGQIHEEAEMLFATKDDADNPYNRVRLFQRGYRLGQAIMELDDLEIPHIDTKELNKGKGLPIHEVFNTGLKQRRTGQIGKSTQTKAKINSNQIILNEAQKLRASNPSITDSDIANQIHINHAKERGYSVKTISELIPIWTKGGLLVPSSVRKVRI